MISCLFPDCDRTESGDPELAKRAIIDHINNDHADAHVLIPCAHAMAHVEFFTATTRSGDTGAVIEIPQERLQCPRCGQFEVRGVESAGEESEGEDGE